MEMGLIYLTLNITGTLIPSDGDMEWAEVTPDSMDHE